MTAAWKAVEMVQQVATEVEAEVQRERVADREERMVRDAWSAAQRFRVLMCRVWSLMSFVCMFAY